MPIENATHISDLNPDWPVGSSDFVSQGDDHMRMQKKVLQNTFPNANAPITATPEQIDNVAIGIQYHEMDDGTGYYDVYKPDRSTDAAFSVRTCTIQQYLSSTHLAVNFDFISLYIYPVGCEYKSYTDSRNPYDILGFGTWEPVAGLIAGVGEAVDTMGYVQSFAAGYRPGFWRVQNEHIVAQTLNLDGGVTSPGGGHQHGHATENSYWGDSNHTALMAGDGGPQGGTAGEHSHPVTGTVTIGQGTVTDSTVFFNPYYGAYIWRRTA
ncbi:hypothetical protein D6E29_04505 [Salmonella enterica]|nr:hypothetical protein [Salmonella enterica]